MAKAKVVHSEQSVMVLMKGNKNSPEPQSAIIKFPGGQVEVTRCTDGKTYWAHIHINESTEILNSRIDYAFEVASERSEKGLKPIPIIDNEQSITKMAVRLEGQYESTEYL